MQTPENNGVSYYLPLKVQSAFTPAGHMCCLICIGGCVSVWAFSTVALWVQIIFTLLGAMLFGLYLYISVFHRGFLWMTKESLYVHIPFYTRTQQFIEIDKVECKFLHFCPMIFVTTMLKKKIYIPLFLFHGLNAEILQTTVETESFRAISALPEPEEDKIVDSADYKYSLPLKIHSKMTLEQHIVFVFLTLFFFGAALFFLLYYQEYFWGAFISLPCSVVTLLKWLYYGVLQKGYICADKKSIRVKLLAQREAEIFWKDIVMVDIVGENRTTKSTGSGSSRIRIVTYEENTHIFSLPSASKQNNNDSHSDGCMIPMDMFSTLNRYRFMRTVRDMMDAHPSEY